MESLFGPHEGSATYAAYVTFEPGARTNWHIHPKGQALIVTNGTGYVQEWGKEPVLIQPGDVVWCPAGIKHWHGATSKNAMTHLAILEKSDKDVVWLEPVGDNGKKAIRMLYGWSRSEIMITLWNRIEIKIFK